MCTFSLWPHQCATKGNGENAEDHGKALDEHLDANELASYWQQESDDIWMMDSQGNHVK